jgi:hypothetical protein
MDEQRRIIRPSRQAGGLSILGDIEQADCDASPAGTPRHPRRSLLVTELLDA